MFFNRKGQPSFFQHRNANAEGRIAASKHVIGCLCAFTCHSIVPYQLSFFSLCQFIPPSRLVLLMTRMLWQTNCPAHCSPFGILAAVLGVSEESRSRLELQVADLQYQIDEVRRQQRASNEQVEMLQRDRDRHAQQLRTLMDRPTVAASSIMTALFRHRPPTGSSSAQPMTLITMASFQNSAFYVPFLNEVFGAAPPANPGVHDVRTVLASTWPSSELYPDWRALVQALRNEYTHAGLIDAIRGSSRLGSSPFVYVSAFVQEALLGNFGRAQIVLDNENERFPADSPERLVVPVLQQYFGEHSEFARRVDQIALVLDTAIGQHLAGQRQPPSRAPPSTAEASSPSHLRRGREQTGSPASGSDSSSSSSEPENASEAASSPRRSLRRSDRDAASNSRPSKSSRKTR